MSSRVLVALLCAATTACVIEAEPLDPPPAEVAERVVITELTCHVSAGAVTVSATFDVAMDEGKAFEFDMTPVSAISAAASGRHHFGCGAWQLYGYGDGDEAGCERLPGTPDAQQISAQLVYSFGAVAMPQPMRVAFDANVIAEPFGRNLLLESDRRVLDCL